MVIKLLQRNSTLPKLLALVLIILCFDSSHAAIVSINPSIDLASQMTFNPGDIFLIPNGTFQLDTVLSISGNGQELRGI